MPFKTRLRLQRYAALGLLSALFLAGSALADDGEEAPEEAAATLPPVEAAGPGRQAPPFGLFYQRFEPTFYTGFAPRALEPERVHLHMGRGNQLRATVVLSDEVLTIYAQDLLARQRTLGSLIQAGDIQLTQNAAYEAMEATCRSVGLEALVAAEKGMAPEALRERNLGLLERLNPGRVFRIRIPVSELVARWIPAAAAAGEGTLSREAQRDLLDALLPTRIYTDTKRIDAPTTAALTKLVAEAKQMAAAPRAEAVAALRPDYLALLERISDGRYPVRGDALEFVEFTALYPIGSVNEFTRYKGREIPLYPSPGRRELTTHQRSLTIDHIAEVPTYSYSPWIPYMHVGPKMHNAFHTPFWELRPASASFLPDEIQKIDVRGRGGVRLGSAYLLSRGPASHGCTHVNPGHLVELRQILPSEAESLDDVEVFINKSHLFDVFDIDGDLSPEAMGVGYFVAYSIYNEKPGKMRVPVERTAFYDWLYGGEIHFERDGRGYFTDVLDADFVGDSAVEGARYGRLPLYEARYEPERVQFYALRPIPFVRELRKVGAHHPFSRERAKDGRKL